MDKLREDFEAWYNTNIGKSTVFKAYDQSYLRRDTQEAWLVWQASSIPEGYVVVQKYELLRKIHNIRDLNRGEHSSDEIEENICGVEAMIEAVEKNDE